MPLYLLRESGADGPVREQELGFFGDDGATAYARRMARGAKIEVLKDGASIFVLEPGSGDALVMQEMPGPVVDARH